MAVFSFLMGLMIDPNNILFSIAFILLMVAFIGEVLGFLVMGTGIFSFLDSLMPDHADVNIEEHMSFNIFSWAKHKNVPISIWSAIILASFTIIGFVLQYAYSKYTGHTMNIIGSGAIALIPSVLIAKVMTHGLGKNIFVDTTVAIELIDLVGYPASIVIGECSFDKPAQCKIIDKFQKSHYIQCVPYDKSHRFNRGDSLIVVEMVGSLAVVDVNRKEMSVI